MGILAAHIKSLRKNAGITQAQLAARIEVGVTTIKNLESEYITAPPMKLIEKIAQTFFVDSNSLLYKNSLDVGERSKLVHVVSSISSEKPFVEINKIVETVFLDRDDLHGYDYMGIKIQDESMINEHITPGSSAIVRMDAIVRSGDIVLAVYNDSEGVVRRYETDGKNIILRAANSNNLYPDIHIDPEKDRFVLIGKVVSWYSKAPGERR